jgi:hypothetical protein
MIRSTTILPFQSLKLLRHLLVSGKWNSEEDLLALPEQHEGVVFNPILGTTNSVCGELCIGPLSFVLYYAARRSK